MVLPMDFFLTISSLYESDDSLDQEHDEDSLSSQNSDRSTSLESDMFFSTVWRAQNSLDWLNLFHMRVEVKLFFSNNRHITDFKIKILLIEIYYEIIFNR